MFVIGKPGRRLPSRAERPKTPRTPENIERVRQLVENDRRLTKRMITKELRTGTEYVRLILTEDFGKQKLCCRLVPHRLTPEQIEMRHGTCGGLIDMADGDRNFLNNSVASKESWCLKYNHESK
ncbi:uncharacterized protein TNCV_2224791 [Trichonephila clavipes]|nr:uncharacterized protein TNCV_2224791 [Trichonephila clavipes]